ncbi:MAG: zinc-ribbon domain-containing protein [Acutalibacteraceae bacterium]
MQTCPTCGRTVGDNVKFCPGCGSKMPQGNVCPVCGRENREGAAFCSACGAALIGQRPAPQPRTPGKPQSQGKPQGQSQGQSQGQPQNRAPHGGPGQPMPGQAMPAQAMPPMAAAPGQPGVTAAPKPKKKMSRGKKAALFGGVGVVLLGIIAVLVLFVFRPMTQVQKVDPNSLYARGCEVYYLNEKGEEVPLTNQLFTDNSIDNQMMASDGPSLGYYIAVSDDGTRIFYPDQAQTDAYGPSLYTRLLSEPAEKAVMIDSEVAQFQITSDGKKVTYIRGGDHALYQSDLQNKTRIAADVAAFTGSPDGQTVFYADATGVMYQWTSEGGSKQIAGNAAVIKGIATDKMAAYYIQDGALYEQVAGSDAPKQIATDVQKVVWITPDGQVLTRRHRRGHYDGFRGGRFGGGQHPVYAGAARSPQGAFQQRL